MTAKKKKKGRREHSGFHLEGRKSGERSHGEKILRGRRLSREAFDGRIRYSM
jgi:hypothetical protein